MREKTDGGGKKFAKKDAENRDGSHSRTFRRHDGCRMRLEKRMPGRKRDTVKSI
jgi:hypothetical protein